MSIKCYTDYPFFGKQELIEVEVLSYDRDKYCVVVIDGKQHDVKRGWLYTNSDKTETLSRKTLYTVPREPGGKQPTRRDVTAELKHDRRAYTEYTVWVGGKQYHYDTLKKALKKFKQNAKQHSCSLIEIRTKSSGDYTICPIVVSDNGSITLITTFGSSRTRLKSSRF